MIAPHVAASSLPKTTENCPVVLADGDGLSSTVADQALSVVAEDCTVVNGDALTVGAHYLSDLSMTSRTVLW